MDDVLLNKVATIERCLDRVQEEYRADPERLRGAPCIQDSIVLNLQRACEAAIDLAMHLVRVHRLGVPQDSRDAFRLLERSGRLDAEGSVRLQRMVGFRNIAVHDYQRLNLDIVQAIVERESLELLTFARDVLRRSMG